MKKLYNEFFYVPQRGKGKVCEKVMVSRITFSVVLILVCMAAMSFTAYAYFSHTLTANVAVIQSATWEIKATPEADVVLDGEFYQLDNHNGAEDRTFEFNIKEDSETATATVGYVRIDIKTDVDGLQTYYSQPIGDFLEDGKLITDSERSVKIIVPAGKTAYVKFTGEWGTCAKEPIIEESAGIEPRFSAAASVPAQSTPASDDGSHSTDDTASATTPTQAETVVSSTDDTVSATTPTQAETAASSTADNSAPTEASP